MPTLVTSREGIALFGYEERLQSTNEGVYEEDANDYSTPARLDLKLVKQ